MLRMLAAATAFSRAARNAQGWGSSIRARLSPVRLLRVVSRHTALSHRDGRHRGAVRRRRRHAVRDAVQQRVIPVKPPYLA